MKENFSNLTKEIDIEAQEAQRVPIKLDPKRTTPRHIIIKMSKIKREYYKQQEKSSYVPTKEFPLDYQLISQKIFCIQEVTGKKYSIPSDEKQGPAT